MCWALRIKRKFAFDICKRTELIQWQDGHTSYRTELYLDGFWDLCNKLFKLSTECKSCKQVSVVGQVSARDITSVKRQPYRAADFGATLPTREGEPMRWSSIRSSLCISDPWHRHKSNVIPISLTFLELVQKWVTCHLHLVLIWLAILLVYTQSVQFTRQFIKMQSSSSMFSSSHGSKCIVREKLVDDGLHKILKEMNGYFTLKPTKNDHLIESYNFKMWIAVLPHSLHIAYQEYQQGS